MIQQQSKLCLGAMKLVQWQSVVRSVMRTSWPNSVKSRTLAQPYSTSPTVAQERKSSPNATSKTEQKKENPPGVRKTQTKSIPSELPNTKEVEAMMKVKALSSAIDISSTFNPQQCVQALKNLVVAKTRPLPLIQTLTERISGSTQNLNIKELSDLLFALGKLRHIHADVLSSTCEALKTQLKGTTNAAVVGSSISSLRNLQWKDPDLLDEYSIWIQKNFVKFQNPSTFIYTLALQNHSPPNLEDLLKLIWKRMSTSSSTELVNLVWSINVLNCPHTAEETRRALNGFFNQRFLKTLSSGPESVPVWIKLWNLQAVAKSLWGHAELDIPAAVKNKISTTLVKSDKAAMISEVTQLLFKDLDSNLYSANVSSNMGFPIDFIFCINKDMTAVPLHLATPDCIRLAVMIHSFHECCQPSKEPNGYRVFEMRLLEEDFKVISVPYHILGGGYAQVHSFFESALSSVAQKNKLL
ncbi:FAST kinase domain-containing protein 4 [Frankliniella fusca]|uniref:FAST kinase domain-containing protein 4 n=1 Tax=Frankliniella fusca TaxID=407009 RepID=A0AAE1LPU7_9NEOP|nr:FAST kinase domain-containing protein 4 [Frankliniella fusca]